MKKYILFFLVLCYVSNSIYAQGRIQTQKRKSIDSLSKILETKIDNDKKISILNNIGTIYYSQGNYPKAKDHYIKAQQLFNSDTDSLLTAKVLFNIGNTYDDLGSYNKAVDNLLQSINIYTALHRDKEISQSVNAIAVTHIRLKEYNKAIEYLKNAIKISSNINDTIGLIKAKKHVAIVYKKLKKYKKSIEYNLQVANYELLKKNFSSLGKTYNNLGNVYTKIKKYDSALYYQEKSFALKSQYGNERDLINAHISYGNLYYRINRLNLSKNHLKKAIEIANDKKHPYELMNALQSLAVVLYDKKDYKYAFNTLEKYTILSDSLRNIKVKSNISELETKYQTKQKEAKILKLSNENLKKEAQLTRSKYTIYLVISLLLLTFALTIFFWQQRKQKQKLALLETTVKASEEEKKRIGKELHDGIAGSLIRLVHDTEKKDIKLADQLLNTYNEIRDLSHQLDNTPMHGELFMERLIDIIPQGDEDQSFAFTVKPTSLELYEPYGTHIFRIVQELITNNLKHAKAHKTKIDILLSDDTLQLKYKDDGIGISNFTKGNGFKNMEDRVQLMKGTFSMDLNVEKGVFIRIDIPFKTKEKN